MSRRGGEFRDGKVMPQWTLQGMPNCYQQLKSVELPPLPKPSLLHDLAIARCFLHMLQWCKGQDWQIGEHRVAVVESASRNAETRLADSGDTGM